MILNEILDKSPTKTVHLELEDPETGEVVEGGFYVHYTYDSGDVGFGTGPGKSPFQPEYTVEYLEVKEPFVFRGKTFRQGEEIDIDSIKQFIDQRSLDELEL